MVSTDVSGGGQEPYVTGPQSVSDAAGCRDRLTREIFEVKFRGFG